MKRKLIERSQGALIVCDNPKCDYKYPYSEEAEKVMIVFVNMPCPKCGDNLLTPQDYLVNERVLKTVNKINKWFSWLTIFYPKDASKSTLEMQIHDGVKMKITKQ